MQWQRTLDIKNEHETETGNQVIRKTNREGQEEWDTDIIREARKAVQRG